MGSKVVAYRQFLNDRDNSYVSVITDVYSSYDEINKYTAIELAISDEFKCIGFEWTVGSKDMHGDTLYEEAMSELEKIRVAVITAMDELVDAYSGYKFGELDDNEEELDAESQANREV